MSIFKRIARIFKSNVNASLESIENPIRMTEEGIRELKKKLQEGIEGLASVKAVAIRTERELRQLDNASADLHNKAVALLRKAESGSLDVVEADNLASAALERREGIEVNRVALQENFEKYTGMGKNLEAQIRTLKTQIEKYENELKMLRARHQVSKASSSIQQQLSTIDTSGTIAMLEQMKNKIEQQEAKAQAYAQLNEEEESFEKKVDAALGTSAGGTSVRLLELKEKLGMTNSSSSDEKD